MLNEWKIRFARVHHRADEGLWALVTVAVRVRASGLCVRSKLVPSQETAFVNGSWSSVSRRESPADAHDPPSSRIRTLEGQHASSMEGYESACFSGVFHAARVLGDPSMEVELLETSGVHGGDITGFAIASSAAVLTAMKPDHEMSSLNTPAWTVTERGTPSS